MTDVASRAWPHEVTDDDSAAEDGVLPVSVGEAMTPDANSDALTKFGFVTVVVHRVRQLLGGARPRLASNGHKMTRVAVLEVNAGMVSWDVAPEAMPKVPVPGAERA